MGSVPAELSLDLRPTFVPKTISDFFYEVSKITNASERFLRVDDFLKRLQEEMRKIDAFKRELPLCMILLNDAILAVKEESTKCRPANSQPVLEEFIPLKKECDQKEEIKKEKECKDKKNWMSSVQLWNTSYYPTTNNAYEQTQHFNVENKKIEEEEKSVAKNPFQSCRNRNEGRGFMPLTAYSAVPVTAVATKEEKEEPAIDELSLRTPGMKILREGSASTGSRSSSNRGASSSPPTVQPNLRVATQQQSGRKQRRCWSPELHRRFVNALQQLGGSQAATPKQIRELMQVDGLTNDEVKSHLQKYRLHTRRIPPSSAATANQSVVVLGGLWMSQDQYNESSKASSSSGSPQGPLQLTASGRGSSPNSMEDDEDEKSESHSWKNQIHRHGTDDV